MKAISAKSIVVMFTGMMIAYDDHGSSNLSVTDEEAAKEVWEALPEPDRWTAVFLMGSYAWGGVFADLWPEYVPLGQPEYGTHLTYDEALAKAREHCLVRGGF